jgi:SPOR domain
MTMSNSALRAPSINLDEFERRLRATGSLGGAQEDPLAELSRLLGIEEPGEEGSQAGERSASPAPIAAPPVQSGEESSTQLIAPSELESALAEGSSHATAPDEPAAPSPPAGNRPLAPQDIEGAGGRSRGAMWTIALLLVIGAAGAAGAWVYHIGVPGLEAKLPPLIMAAEGPTKVQPPSQETVSSPNDMTSLLAKDQQGKGAPVNVVSNAEQPVDLAAQSKAQAGAETQSNAPPANGPSIAAAPLVVVAQPSSGAATPAASSPGAAGNNSLSSAAVAPPGAAPAPANQASAPTSDASAAATPPAAPEPPTPFPQPKRVKTVSVRPDGSVIASATPTDDATLAGGAPALVETPKPNVRPPTNAADAEQATPKLDLPAKPAAKSTARVPVNKLDTTAATANSQSPEGPLQISPTAQNAPKKNSAGTHVADATNPSLPTVLPNDSTPAQPSAKAAVPAAGQTRTAHLAASASADAGANAPAAAEGGKSDYAVQLAAPGSEAEAQSASARLKAKFAAELGGADPVIRKAELQGRTVYRVRVVGMAKSDAVSLCEKLKAGGGACFIARE